MTMNRNHILPLLAAFVFLSACNGFDVKEDDKKIDPDRIYLDYRIWGDEEAGEMTVKLQFRNGGPEGKPILLKDPAKVELDGKALQADSSKMNGVYYEVAVPALEFAGSHAIVFTAPDKQQYSEEFSFQPILLKTKVPAEITRGDLSFELKGLSDTDYVRVMMTDTTSFGEGIVRFDTVVNGKITVTKEALARVASGPVHFKIDKDVERRVKNSPKQGGGRLSVSYGLKREFMLKEK